MRAIAILTLLLAFVVTVILPNDIGTNDLPATGVKHLVVKASSHMVKPVKGGPSACVLLLQLRGETFAASDCQLNVYRSGRTVSNAQLSAPLLI